MCWRGLRLGAGLSPDPPCPPAVFSWCRWNMSKCPALLWYNVVRGHVDICLKRFWLQIEAKSRFGSFARSAKWESEALQFFLRPTAELCTSRWRMKQFASALRRLRKATWLGRGFWRPPAQPGQRQFTPDTDS